MKRIAASARPEADSENSLSRSALVVLPASLGIGTASALWQGRVGALFAFG